MWIKDIENRVTQLRSRLDEVEIRRLQLDYLPTVAKRLDIESADCERCEHLKKDIEEALSIIEKADVIKESQRRAYNTRIKRVVSHFRKVHGLLSRNFYANQYANLGLIGGILAGLWFLDQFVLMIVIILMGPFIGKLIGSFKDKKNTENLI